MNPFAWFMSNLKQMPKWVQIATWFIMLLLTCYLYVAPRFINGHAVFRTDSGGMLDYRGATLRTHMEGRVFKFKSNEDGYWSVPVVSRLPQDMRLELYHEDKGAWFEVRIGSADIWKAGFGAVEVRLIVDGDQPVQVEVVMNDGRTMFAAVAQRIWSLFSRPAHAQARSDRAEIARRTVAAMAAVVKSTPARVTESSRLTGRNAPTYAQKLQIIDKLEKEFEIVIPDEKWRQMERVGDLVEFIDGKLP